MSIPAPPLITSLPNAAAQKIVVGVARDRVAAGATDHHLEVDDAGVGLVGARIESSDRPIDVDGDVHQRLAQESGVTSERNGVEAATAIEDVDAGASRDEVSTVSAEDRIGAVTAVERVGPGAADERVGKVSRRREKN